MKRKLHLTAAVLATLCIATFFAATIFVELFGSSEAVATVKQLIVNPGLFILVPAIATAGISGFLLSNSCQGPLTDRKKQRMPFIGANGLLILLPAAILLDRWASAGSFDSWFYAVQGLELAAGAVNLTLMGLNIRDGLRMAGRPRSTRDATPQEG